MRKYALCFCVLMLVIISIVPRHSHAIAGAALRIVGGSLAERALTATMQRVGYEVGSVSAAEKARKRFNLDLWEGIGAPDGPAQYQQQQRMSYERAVALHNELNKKATPIPSKPGWGKIALSSLSFLTAADLIYEGYEAYKDGREAAMLADSASLPAGSHAQSVDGYYVRKYSDSQIAFYSADGVIRYLKDVSGLIDCWIEFSDDSSYPYPLIGYRAVNWYGDEYVGQSSVTGIGTWYGDFAVVSSPTVVQESITDISSSPIGWGYVPTPVPEPLPDSYPVEVPDTVYIEVPIRDETELDREVPSEWPDAWEVTDPLREQIEKPNPVFDPANDPLKDPVPVPQPEPLPYPEPLPEPLPVPEPPVPPGDVPGEGQPTIPLDMRPLLQVGDTFTRKFPFSIPWDLYRHFQLFNIEPKAPNFHIKKDPWFEIGGHEFVLDVPINLEFLDPYADIVRWVNTFIFDLAIIFLWRRLAQD